MPRSDSLRGNASLRVMRGETEYAHTGRLMEMHRQLFPASLLSLLAGGGGCSEELYVYKLQISDCHIYWT